MVRWFAAVAGLHVVASGEPICGDSEIDFLLLSPHLAGLVQDMHADVESGTKPHLAVVGPIEGRFFSPVSP